MAITTIDTTAPANTVLTASTVLPPPAVAGAIGRQASPGLPGGFVDPAKEFQIDTSQLPPEWTPPAPPIDENPTAGSVVIPTVQPQPKKQGMPPWVIPAVGFALAAWFLTR